MTRCCHKANAEYANHPKHRHLQITWGWQLALLLIVSEIAFSSSANTMPMQIAAPASPAHVSPPPKGPAASRTLRLLPLDVELNGAKVGSWLFVESNGNLFVNVEAFTEWRLRHQPTKPPLKFRNQDWYALNEIAGYKAEIDYAAMRLQLQFSSLSFTSTEIEEEAQQRPTLAPSQWAFFVNYDLSYTQSEYPQQSYKSNDLGSLTELGLTGPWGLLTSSFIGMSSSSETPRTSMNWTRLETRMVRNFQETNTTWSVGDTATRAGQLSRPVYFGGLQVRRNFGLTPNFVTQPVPVLAGTSASPSTIEVYINNALRQTSRVPTGPFAIQNQSPITGEGDARVVVRDALGRETVITQSFFSDSSLLATNLSDWSFELGSTRRNLGLSDADYGESFASGLWRSGITDSFTLETHGAWSQSLREASIGGNFTLPLKTVGQAGISASEHNTAGQGTQWMLGLRRHSLRHGISLRIDGSTSEYRWLGNSNLPASPSQIVFAYNYAHPQWGSFSFNVGQVRSPTANELIQTAGLGYSMRVGQASLSLTATRFSGPTGGGDFFGVLLMLPTEKMINYFANISQQGGRTDSYISAHKGQTAETGTGWRVLNGNRGGQTYDEGGVSYQGPHGQLDANISLAGSQQTTRVGARGGLVWMERNLFVSRTVQDSFALVEVPGYANVSVGLSGSRLTRTNSDGLALLPRLHAYSNNSVRLAPEDLPISAELDNIEQIVAPAWRSAVKVKFPVRSGRGALLTIVLDDGAPAPAGAEIQIKGDKQIFYVARRGLAFVTGLTEKNSVQLYWQDSSCTLDFELPAHKSDDIPRVGPLVCKGVRH